MSKIAFVLTVFLSQMWAVLGGGTRGLQGASTMNFNRVSFFPVCKQLDASCRTDNVTNSEILDVSKDGNTLVYSDSEMGALGFVDITDPYHPTGTGTIMVGGEPTSVGVVKDYVVVVVNTSPDFVNVSGILHIIHIPTQSVERTMDLEGQPDSIAVSPDERFVAIAIENERDEDLPGGEGLPQLPGGFVLVLQTESVDISDWELTRIELTNLNDGIVEVEDPEPEYLDINADNICILTLQENNGLVLIDLEAMEVISSFSAGSVTLMNIDAVEDGVIFQNSSLTLSDVPREPDGVTWINSEYFVTADEGDWLGGSRGFTVFDKSFNVVYSSGVDLENLATSYGHYPEARADAKGNEPENVEFAMYGDDPILIVNSERASLVLVYDISDPAAPRFLQALPAGLEPEGAKAIPNRNLLVVASEVDDVALKVRAGISIYMRSEAPPQYPTLISDDNMEGTPIPFAALSGLAAAQPPTSRRRMTGSGHQLRRKLSGEEPMPDFTEGQEPLPSSETILYSIEDSYYKKNRMFVIDTQFSPARIIGARHIKDSNGVFAAALGDNEEMKGRLINTDDNTVNIDPEGIATSTYKGGFWLAHEGAGTVGDELRPVMSPNVLFKLDSSAVIEEVILLPAEVNDLQVRFGFEGVAEDGPYVVVCFQRAWTNETDPRIGIYNSDTEEWSFVFYPLGNPESQNGGWVGLSDIAPMGNGQFMVIERDDQAGLDAAIKRLYKIDLGDFSMEEGTVIEKTFYRDLIPDIAAYGGAILEKVEGVAVMANGDIWANTDNDGVDDSSGEQLLWKVGASC